MEEIARRSALAAVLAAVFLVAGCRSNGWVYRNSSRYYRDPDGVMSEGLMTYGQAGVESALVAVLWPFVLDTLALPVALVHDRFFMDEEPRMDEEFGDTRVEDGGTMQLARHSGGAAHSGETR